MDETDKKMFYAYLAQSMYNQSKILEILCKDRSGIDTYKSNSQSIARYFSLLSQGKTTKEKAEEEN